MTDEQVLRELQAAGLDSLPGGGAEIFAERVRRKICHDKCGADRYLDDPPHRARPRHAHERHDALRPHRDDRPSASITCCARARCRTTPAGSRRSSRWRFIPTTTRCGSCRRRSASDTLRVHAVARLMLDNIPHMKAFWIATGVDVAQIALWFGVDDLDGTVQEEKIYHMAGARTPEAMTTSGDPPPDPWPPAASPSSATRSTTSSPGPRPGTDAAVARRASVRRESYSLRSQDGLSWDRSFTS